MIELGIWVRGLCDLLGLALTAELEKRHLKLLLKFVLETLPYRKLEVWIAEDKLLQAETGIRTDHQHKAISDLVDWRILAPREDEDRGVYYRINMSGWVAPRSKHCINPLRNRSRYIRRRRDQLSFEFISQEINTILLQLKFEAFGKAALSSIEQPDGKPFPCAGGVINEGPVAISLGVGSQGSSYETRYPEGGELYPRPTGDSEESESQTPNQSPTVGDCANNVKRCNGSTINVLGTFKVKAESDRIGYLIGAVREILEGKDEKSEPFWRQAANYWPDELDRAIGELRERLHRTHLGPLKKPRPVTLTGMLKRSIGEDKFKQWRVWLKTQREMRQ